jgi:hypothetical protein
MSAPARRKKREEECWKQWRKAYLYFYRQNFAVILSSSSVCKIDITLYSVSFLERCMRNP